MKVLKKYHIILLIIILIIQFFFIGKLLWEKDQKNYEVNLVKINTEKDSVDFPKLKSNLLVLEKTIVDLQNFFKTKNIENQTIEAINLDSLSSVVYLAKQSNRYSEYLVELQNKLMLIPMGMPTNGYISSQFGMRKNPIPTRALSEEQEVKIENTNKIVKENLAKSPSDSSEMVARISAPKNLLKTKVLEKNNAPAEKDQMQFHKGIDIAVPFGSDVFCTASGTVIYAGQKSGYGYCVIVSHGNGLATLYAHLSNIMVKPSERVKVNQVIAKSGNSGRSTGPHLHYEVHKNNTPVNPKLFLNL